MFTKQKKTASQHIQWWWSTRIAGFFKVRAAGYIREKMAAKPDIITFNKDAEPMPAPSNDGITVILTAYLRSQYLAEQIKALKAQTVPPKEIWVWSNRSTDDLRDVSELADRVVVSNTNFLFWGRFSLAMMARTKYVAFFDDDILPQPRWFENCLNTIASGDDGILGGSGVLLPTTGGYSSKHKAGWNGNQFSQAVQVDLVGHAWFMKKEYLKYMWYEEPYTWDNGEDIHLSYMALKHGGIKTFVPPHPTHDLSLWSCRPDFGKIVGRLSVATYKTGNHRNIRSEIVDVHTADGWQVVKKDPEFTLPNERTFSGDLIKLNHKIDSGENFSLVRFGDGEMKVINGDAIDFSNKDNGEHKYTPDNEEDEKYRQILANSLTYQNPAYFVGLPCRCCVGDKNCDDLRLQSKQHDKQLTWANIFVNSNYPKFLEETMAVLSEKTLNIICHEKATFENFPLQINKDFRVGGNAWVKDYEPLYQELSDYIRSNKIENQIFLFCAGVLSNMMIYKLTQEFPNNTYIDIGSCFDDLLGLGKTRKYLKGSKKRLNQVCVW